MNEYRVTKYDPSLRGPDGSFMGDAWTSVAQIGESFASVVLTEEEYQRVEGAYVYVALAFLEEGGVTTCKIEGLENSRGLPLTFSEGDVVRADQLPDIMRQLLREQFWCRLVAPNGFVHFGWDFYMYIGVPHRCVAAERKAAAAGLFVEEFPSPHHKESRR